MKVVVGGKAVRIDWRSIVGQGGEAEVFRFGAAEVIKLFKQPGHPDFAADSGLQRAAEIRLAEHQHKLAAFPSRLPCAVVAPSELVTDKSGRVIGYTMRYIGGAQPLYALGQARSRRDRGPGAQTKVLVRLHEALTALHRTGIVIGDFNDLNVLVADDAPFLIDCDSYQFGVYRCGVYSERFLDPSMTDGRGNVALDYSESSDWFAFCAIAVQTLLSVGPYGGIHRPLGSAPRVKSSRRSLKRLSIFNAKVQLPKPALSPQVLPKLLQNYFHAVFANDYRAPMPVGLLAGLQWKVCTSCGAEFATRGCPFCAPHVTAAPVRVPTSARVVSCPARIAALRGQAAGRKAHYWLEGQRLLRRGALGPEHVGDVMSSATRFWVGETFGFGFYCAGRLRVGFVFDTQRRGINDQVELDPVSGAIASASCPLSESQAWLTVVASAGASLRTTLTMVDKSGERLAAADVSDAAWAAGLAGACAIGNVLLVPSDDGVLRIEVAAGRFVVGKTFAATRSTVDSATLLVSDGRGLYALSGQSVFELAV